MGPHSTLSNVAFATGSSRLFRSRLALTTILTVAPFMGYGRQAFAACDPLPSPTFVCSGANAVSQVINADNANVSTVPGFSVTAPAGDGVAITGDGDIRFTDNNVSTIESAAGNGLFAISTSDDGPIAGAVTITTNGNISGLLNGINGQNFGSGDLAITADGDVTGTNGDGIFARNSSDGVNLTITTGAGSAITGDDNGINGLNLGSGDLAITANGEVTGTNGNGIAGYNSSGGVNLTITTGPGSAVMGNSNGIDGRNLGGGDLAITANGQVTGTTGAGIIANNSSGGVNLTITTGAGSAVTGNSSGIDGQNFGGGDLEITANGEVTGITGDGIVGYNSPAGVNLTITTGAGSAVTGNLGGVRGVNFGGGDLEITADGEVTGTNGAGIIANNSSAGVNLTVTTGAGSAVTGNSNGIEGRNLGSGDLAITANGEVNGTNGDGIRAYNSSDGVNLTVVTGTGSAVTGGIDGINGSNFGSGDLKITANGAVTGGNQDGIFATNSSDGDYLTITTGAGSVIAGYDDGIDAENYGSGELAITVNGTVTGTDDRGIEAYNDGVGDTIIEVGASGLVQGRLNGIDALSSGGQDITITNDGLVRNLSGESDDQAIMALGGAATIHNNNSLVGTVLLGEFEDTLNNAGLWNIEGGVNDFGGSYDGDTVNNSGTIIAAGDGTVSTLTIIDNLEQFNNSGLVSLVDGGEGDTLNLAALPGPIAYVGNNGKLVVDAFLADGPAGESDVLDIAGTSAGTTNLVVNLTNPIGSTPNFVGIPVIRVSSVTEEDDFNIEGGVLNAGFFAWDLRLFGDTHALVTTGLGAGAHEFAASITGAQDIWHQTTGTLLQRQADLRPLLSATQVTPVADFSEPIAPTPVARVTPGIWFKGVGAYLERDAEEGVLTLDREQTIFGFLGGFDFGTENLGDPGDALMFGLFGGYLTSDLDFSSTDTEWRYEGPTAGVYATYLNDAFYADAIVKFDFLDVDIDAGGIAPDGDAETDVLNIGGLIDAGYKVLLDQGLFVEPQAALAVVHTEVNDVDDIFGGAVEFDDETSVRGRLGLRLGHELTASNAVIYSSDVTASVWQEFAGDNDVTIFAPLTPATGLSDDPGETFGDVSIGFSAAAPDGWSGFLRGNYQFADNYDAFGADAGVRYAW